MPEASLWLEVRNESTSERNWTVIEFHSTQSIDSVVYGDYEYYTEDGRDICQVLIKEGHAVEYHGGTKTKVWGDY